MCFGRTTIALAVLGAAIYGCSTSNGSAIPDPSYDAGPADASGDASKDAGSDAADAGDPVAAVRINEIYVDNAGLGDTTEYIELRGAPGTLLDDLRLRLLDDSGQVSGEIDVASAAGDKIPASGLWVVGGGNTFQVDPSSDVDHVMLGSDLNAWGLQSARGAVQLVRGTARTLLDVVGYDEQSDAGALPQPASNPKQTVEGTPAVAPATQKHSLGRTSGAADTNDNRADFCSMAPTAGRANAVCD
jgi:hypothetical protein